jgi:hypothetical protein
VQGKAELVAPLASLETRLPVQLTADRATLTLHLLLYHCREGQEGLCYLYEKRLTVPLQRGGKANTIPLTITVSL